MYICEKRVFTGCYLLRYTVTLLYTSNGNGVTYIIDRYTMNRKEILSYKS